MLPTRHQLLPPCTASYDNEGMQLLTMSECSTCDASYDNQRMQLVHRNYFFSLPVLLARTLPYGVL